MDNRSAVPKKTNIAPFNRKFLDADQRISSLGSGSIGGKAQGLAFLNQILASDFDPTGFPTAEVSIPSLTVIRTDVFDAFMERNDLYGVAYSDAPDDRIAHAFQNADLPFEILGDLHALTAQMHTPLAVRSSSLLEDATFEPFAGIYGTKMIPNHQHENSIRFQRLVEAIKFVYASTFSRSAKSYRQATRHQDSDEKMAVIIQEVLGKRHNDRFYPELSGVARSFNFYPMGRAKHEDGVVNLALGLGKTIVDGGISWIYSPSYPKIAPPFGSIGELLRFSQRDFWAINMGTPPAYDPMRETEYLLHEDLGAAEMEGTLEYLCSTYDTQADRLVPGMSASGPRLLNFAPLLSLRRFPLNDLVKGILSLCQSKLDSPVEIEFAMTFHPHRFGLLQVRPMVVSTDQVQVRSEELTSEAVVLASENVLGNGILEHIRDIVCVIPARFEVRSTPQIARELANLNQALVSAGTPYLLIVFGRLGSSDPWLGIPVDWGQISGAKMIVEASLEGIHVDMSQGSHFFHNLTSLGVGFFSMPSSGKYEIDWGWLDDQQEMQSTQFVRHIRTAQPLVIKIDGRSGRGVILRR